MSANSAEPTARLEIVLVKAGRTKIRYPAELLHDDGTRIAVRAPWAGSGVRDFGFVRFEAGDVFTEYYWSWRTSTWTCGAPPTGGTYGGWTRTSSPRAV